MYCVALGTIICIVRGLSLSLSIYIYICGLVEGVLVSLYMILGMN